MPKLIALLALISLFFGNPAHAESGRKVGDFKIGNFNLGMASTHNVVYAIPDPKVRGATCFITTVEIRGMSMASDPSNTSVACRQTGQMFEEDTKKVNQSPAGEIIFSSSKGGLNKHLGNLFKELNVRRIWDAQTQTYLYGTYTTKLIDGSNKVSMSAISTYGAF